MTVLCRESRSAAVRVCSPAIRASASSSSIAAVADAIHSLAEIG
jgi:hypothetical protein